MFRRIIASVVSLSLIFSSIQPLMAQQFSLQALPVPGSMVNPSEAFAPLVLKGLVINPQKPLEFQFILDTGKGPQDQASIKEESTRLIKYFLAGLTIPEGDLWVNLSPYEKDRIVPDELGKTELGRDLLAQDYVLKQLTASFIYPEKDLGKTFWQKVYQKAQEEFGAIDIPVNTFNKVWILPDRAQVFENGNAVYVTQAKLKVMLDEDYLAKEKREDIQEETETSTLSSQIIREIVIPEIEKEVNTGKNFAPLRQIYTALILAKWYKGAIKNSVLHTVYTDKNKTAGVDLDDPTVKEQIYQRYVQAYKKGVFNYIKEDQDSKGEIIPRKYFSGGITKLEPEYIDRSGKQEDVKSDGAMLSLTVGLVAVSGYALYQVIKMARQLIKEYEDYEKYGKPPPEEWVLRLEDLVRQRQRALETREDAESYNRLSDLVDELMVKMYRRRKSAFSIKEENSVITVGLPNGMTVPLERFQAVYAEIAKIVIEQTGTFRENALRNLIFKFNIQDDPNTKEINHVSRFIDGASLIGSPILDLNDTVPLDVVAILSGIFENQPYEAKTVRMAYPTAWNIDDLLASYLSPKQGTLQRVIQFTGRGLHLGEAVTMTIWPATSNTGIIFVRNGQEIRVAAENAVETPKATKISQGDAYVMTPEHILSALGSIGVNNAYIYLDSDEVPIFDGSAEAFRDKLLSIGITRLDEERRMFSIEKPIIFSRAGEGVKVLVLPTQKKELRLSYFIDFANPGVGKQFKTIVLTKENYWQEIGSSRTFIEQKNLAEFYKSKRYLGIAHGEGGVILDDHGAFVGKGFAREDDAIRHKILDLFGDLQLVVPGIYGHIIAIGAGHRDHNELGKKIVQIYRSRIYESYTGGERSEIIQQFKSLRDEHKIPEDLYNEVLQNLTTMDTVSLERRTLLDKKMHEDVLLDACEHGEIDVVEAQLALGVDPNAKHDNGFTPLLYAVRKGYLDIAELLIAKGADVNAPSIMMWAVDKPKLLEVLISHGGDVNTRDASGRTPLMSAIHHSWNRSEQKSIVELLLAHGADVNAKADDGATALSQAIKAGRSAFGDWLSGGRELVDMLLAAGAKDNAMLQTPTHKIEKAKFSNGGIDFNQINVHRDDKSVNIQFDPNQLNELMRDGFEGFSPVIINITPIQSPLPLLGVNPGKEVESSLAKV